MLDYKARLGVHKNNYSQRQFLSQNIFSTPFLEQREFIENGMWHGNRLIKLATY